MSKANRQKGAVREKYRFSCDAHDSTFRGPVRFSHEEARKDWNRHNILAHAGRKSTMSKDEAITLLFSQSVLP